MYMKVLTGAVLAAVGTISRAAAICTTYSVGAVAGPGVLRIQPPASRRKVFAAALAAIMLYPMAAHLTLARAQSNTGSGNSPTPRVDLPLQVGFARGGTALYITPEVGVDPSAGPDIVNTAQTIAKGFNANFIPTNFATLPGSAAIRNIFVFTKQGNVLSATPTPPGPGNTNANYSPLWRVNLVTFNPEVTPTLLTSTAAITDAENANQVTVTPTPIIVECSVIFSLSPGGLLPGTKVILDAPSASAGGTVITRGILPLQRGFFDGATALYITPEVGVPPGSSFTSLAQTVAEGFNSNFVPTAFATLPGSGAVDDIFVFTDGTQGNVLASAPHPAGPTNTDTNYSPLWQISLVSFTNGRRRRVLKSQAAIQEAASDGDVTITKTDIIVECSVIFTPGGGLLPDARLIRNDRDRESDSNN
jgi:hypothetical protein